MAEMLASLGRMGLFLLRVLGAIRPGHGFVRDTAAQIYSIGSRSVSIVAVGGAFVGLVLALQGYRTLSTWA